MKVNVVGETCVLKQHLFVLIIRGNFSSIDNRVSQNVRDDTNPETFDTISSIDFAVAIETSFIFNL